MLQFQVQCPLCRWAGRMRLEGWVDMPVGLRLALTRHRQVSERCPGGLRTLTVVQVGGPPPPRQMVE